MGAGQTSRAAGLAAGLLAGCAGGEGAADLPSAWGYDAAPADPAPYLSTEEIGAAVAGIPGLLAWINPHLIVGATHEFQGRMTPDCPASSDHNGQILLEGDCEVADGSGYYGYQLSVEASDVELEFEGVGGFHRVFRWMTGAARYAMADGSGLELLGDVEIRDYDRPEAVGVTPVVSLYLWGDYRRAAPEAGQGAPPGWLDEGIGAQLYLLAEDLPAGRRVAWEGGLIRLPGEALHPEVRAVELRGLTLDTAICDREPEGRISLWDGAGRWIDVVFGAGAGGDPCDGCGLARAQGEGTEVVELGEVCADLSALAAWEGTPWQ